MSLTADLGLADGARLVLRELGVRTYQSMAYPGLERRFEVQFDPVWRWIVRGVRERGLLRFAQDRIGKGTVVIDVGAHLGESSLLFSELVGPSGRVVAFEPDPVACASLRKNLELNGLRNVSVEEKSVSDKTGKALLATERFGSGAASIVRQAPRDAHLRELEVQSTTLDEYCEEHGLVPGWIKIDAEGAEPMIVSGMRGLIERHRPSVILEFHTQGLTGEERRAAWSSIAGQASSVEVLESIPPEYDYLERIEPGQVPESEFLIVHLGY